MDQQLEILSTILDEIDKADIDEISLNQELKDIGIDSLTFVKAIVALECKYDFEFDDEMLMVSKFPTLGALVEYICSKIN